MADELSTRMQEDWNRRAREDAHYWVAFGRRHQEEEEFFATAREQALGLERELRRLPPESGPRLRRALEIGCGPGRLMQPLSRHFAEIHGIDISDEMVRLARERLKGVPNARVQHAPGSDLSMFEDGCFDFVYSYAVFQHIPSREVVFGYLREARRVLKNGGVLRCQINGLPASGERTDTWHGVRISASEVAAFAREHDMQLLALEGAETQYMWTTMIRWPEGWTSSLSAAVPAAPARIRRITNAHSSEPVAPTRGRFATLSLWMERLPADADLNHLEVTVGERDGIVCYIGPPEADGLEQVNVYLPPGLSTGLAPVDVSWLGRTLCPPSVVRLIPAPPPVPRIIALTDGIDLLSGLRIVSGSVKIVAEELERPEEFRVTLDGTRVDELESFCTDPRLPRYEFNFRMPAGTRPGAHALEMRAGRRRFAPITLEVGPGVPENPVSS